MRGLASCAPLPIALPPLPQRIARPILTSRPRTTRQLTPSAAAARAHTATASLPANVGHRRTTSLMPVAIGTVHSVSLIRPRSGCTPNSGHRCPDRISGSPAPCRKRYAPCAAPIPGWRTRPCARPLHRRSNASPKPRAASARRCPAFLASCLPGADTCHIIPPFIPSSLAVASPRSAMPGCLHEPTSLSLCAPCHPSPARSSNTRGALPDSVHRSIHTSGPPMERPQPGHSHWRYLLHIPGALGLQSGHRQPAPRRPAGSHRHLPLPQTRQDPSTHYPPRRPGVSAPLPPPCLAGGLHAGATLRLYEHHLSHHNRQHPTDDHRPNRRHPGAASRHRHHPGAGALSHLWRTTQRPEPRLALAPGHLRYGIRSRPGHIAHVGHAALASGKRPETGRLRPKRAPTPFRDTVGRLPTASHHPYGVAKYCPQGAIQARSSRLWPHAPLSL
jgi:hypothetical protein